MTGEKIMIVDDNKEFLEELQEILTLSGYETIAINDGSAVLESVLRHKPHLILLDLRLQGMNGFQVADQLKNSPKAASIPIIAMSGYFPVERNFTLMDTSDMSACIKKPFGVSELITQIETILKKG